ncbi:MAG: acetoacetate decarboxylase family protein [Sulfolobaceae archaeon]
MQELYKTFTLPITRTGKSQVVPPPPWIYAINMIGVEAVFDSDRLRNVIPPPLESQDGEGFVYIAKIFTIAGNNSEVLYEDPELSKYMEAAIFLKVRYRGNTYTYSPFMWVDKDLPLIRGWLLGYPKKLAIISISEFHTLLEGYEGPKQGIKMGGYALRNGREIVRLRVTLKEKVEKSPIPYGPIVQFRRYPMVIEGQDVYELGQIVSSDFKLGEVWKGEGELILNPSINEELDAFRIERIKAGYYLSWSFKQLGFKVLERF